MERYMCENQRKIWGKLNRNKMEIKDTVQTNKINAEGWRTYFGNLYKDNKEGKQPLIEEDEEQGANIELTQTTIKIILKQLQNRKSPGSDEITNNMKC
ncbi:hypothetical protein Trydic_g1501 [Trypoxylus dichotomus]